MGARLEEKLIAILARSIGGKTFGALLGDLRAEMADLDKRTLQSSVRKLVAEGHLSYTQRLGSTRLCLGGYRSERVSQRIFRTMASSSGTLPDGAVGLHLMAGTAFGAGDHPTTILMLRGLDHALANLYGFEGASVRVLDVGTGNGVLAIAALLLGVAAAVGVDIDPQACHEALLNARDHGVARRLRLVAGTVADIGEDGFDLVLANLRPPTLAELMPGLERMVAEGGGMLLSGFRREEQTAVERLLPADWFMPWQEQDRDWGALIARRGS